MDLIVAYKMMLVVSRLVLVNRAIVCSKPATLKLERVLLGKTEQNARFEPVLILRCSLYIIYSRGAMKITDSMCHYEHLRTCVVHKFWSGSYKIKSGQHYSAPIAKRPTTVNAAGIGLSLGLISSELRASHIQAEVLDKRTTADQL
jgi:hypothetical protein